MGAGTDYWSEVGDHALACALYGDCLFDEVKKGAAELEASWEKLATPFGRLLSAAAKTGIFGLGPALDTKWLRRVLFGPEKNWPTGLSTKERQTLLLARATAGWLTNQDIGDKVDPLGGFDATFRRESEEDTLTALKKFAALFTERVFNPMWDEYDEISKRYGKRLTPMCEERYNEACSDLEGMQLFRGDLARGWKLKTLPFSATTYQVFAKFMALLAM